MASKSGCWCIWCGEMVKAEQMSMHVWRHGHVASIGRCAVNTPSPWSKRQGYWGMNPREPEPLAPAPVTEAMIAAAEAAPLGPPAVGVVQPGLWAGEG